jgi:hypothetical protein
VLSTSAKQIQDKLLNFQLFSKEDESRSRKMLEDRKSELNNAVNTFQLLKNFKEKNSDVNAKKIGSVDSNQKNKIDIENNVPISNAVFIKPDINLENNSKINFIIPELFTLKYGIFDKLNSENKLNFENYREEFNKVKPKNNYDMFSANPYEESFINKKDDKDEELIFDIEL